jgi:bifunctional NMN adenylyltransferase/nudix hydrolase
MKKKYDTLVLIGRFQPCHSAHAEIIRRAMKMSKQLIIIVSSAKKPRTFKNPWNRTESIAMVQRVCMDMEDTYGCVVQYEDNYDTRYNNPAWAARVQIIVGKYTKPTDYIGIIGHKKDEATRTYIDMFPQWEHEQVELIEPLHATSIRDLYFQKDANLNFIKSVVPKATYDILSNWVDSPEYAQIIREREHIDMYKRQYAGLQYEPLFVTVDSIVVCSGHVLMIKRKSEPGKGLWAMPGGFVNAKDPSILLAMIRELKEETGIKVPAPVLIGSITKKDVFDAVDRSARGRTITHAFRIDLPDGELPKVKGMDDAEKAKWVLISQLDSSVCFEDHYEIIQNMLGA